MCPSYDTVPMVQSRSIVGYLVTMVRCDDVNVILDRSWLAVVWFWFGQV